MPHPALVFVVVAWGLNFSVIKLAYHDISPQAVGLVRFVFMLPILLVWCIVAKQGLSYPSGKALPLLAAGFVGSGAYMVMFLEGMRTAPAALGAVALSTAPIITTFLSVLVKQEKFTWRLLFGSLIAFSGVAIGALSAGQSSKGAITGVILVLGSAILWSTSVILYRKILVDMTPIKAFALSFPGAAVALVPYGLQAALTAHWDKVSFRGWSALSYLVVIAGVGAFAAYYKGLADVGPARTTMTQYFVPPTAAIFASLLIHEKLFALEVVGLVIVILGVAIAVFKAPQPIDERTCTDPQSPGTPQSSSA